VVVKQIHDNKDRSKKTSPEKNSTRSEEYGSGSG
jgi:hypothetical protein